MFGELTTLLAATGRADDAEREVAAFEKRTRNQDRTIPEAMKQMRRFLLYVAGDFAKLEQSVAGEKGPAAEGFHYAAVIEQGRVAEVVKTGGDTDGPGELIRSLAWSLAGNAAEADAARLRAIAILAKSDSDDRRAAELLRAGTPPTKPQLDAVVMRPSEKALVCAALAQQFPAQRAELSALARKLNIGRAFPFHLIQRATAPR